MGHMRRRDFLTLLGAAMGLPSVARAQEKDEKWDMAAPVIRI
jgi:hypothetical protein